MPTISTKDGARIDYKDRGAGQPVVFSHGWPLTADAWEGQMLFADRGFRCIAHGRRGHGRSSQPWNGNEMDIGAVPRRMPKTPANPGGLPMGAFGTNRAILHGDDDEIVPLTNSALLSAKLAKGSSLKVIPGAPHGMCSTRKDQINTELLTFLPECAPSLRIKSPIGKGEVP